MPKFGVRYYHAAHGYAEVEASSEDEAQGKVFGSIPEFPGEVFSTEADATVMTVVTPSQPTLDQIIDTANDAYGDGLVLDYHLGSEERDDTLALFIARELRSTYDEGDAADNALHAAADYMDTASRELEAVADALRAAARTWARNHEDDA